MALLLLYTANLLIALILIDWINMYKDKKIRMICIFTLIINLISLIRLGGVITVALKLVTSFK